MKMILKKILLIFLVSSCYGAPDNPTTAAPTPQPMLQIAQRLLSNVARFPTAIQEGMAGKTGEIRKIVSSALGGGLIGQLVENPVQAAGSMGLDLDQFGLNKTMLENSIGLTKSQPWQLPNQNQNMALNPNLNKGDLLFSNQIMASPPAPMHPELTTPAPLYIDGRLVAPQNEDAVLNGIFGGASRVQPKKGRRMEGSQQYYQNNRPQATTPEPLPKNIPIPESLMPKAQPPPSSINLPYPPPPVSPAPASEDDSNALWDPPMMTSQGPKYEEDEYPPPHRAIASAISRVTSGNAEVRHAPMARMPEFNKMNDKILSLEQRLNEQQEFLAKHQAEEKEVKIQKILETLKFGKSNRLSALQKHLRYSPEAVNDDLRLDTQPLKPLNAVNCKCEPITLSQLKGTWTQALASEALISRMNSAIEDLFESKEAKLECASITVTPPRDHNPAYSHFTLSLKLQNATNHVRLPGNIFSGENNQFYMRLIDFDNKVNDIPFCVHQADKGSHYLVIAESTNCQAATLLVKNPEQFFKTTDTKLTNFLKKKISTFEMDRMELVEHVSVCS